MYKNKILYLFLLLGWVSKVQASSIEGLKELSDKPLNTYALVTKSNYMKINSEGNIVKKNLNTINQNQISYNLSNIENMQVDIGSGIYFKQSKNVSNFLEEDKAEINSYNNTLSGKYAIDGENSIMASVNEGKNSMEQITLVNGRIDEAETKILGISLAFNKKLDGYNVFAFIGKNWIGNKFETLGDMNGQQIHLGVGANYKTIFDDVTLIPQLNIQKIKSSLKNKVGENNISGFTNQTTANLGLKTNYKMSNKILLGASLNYEKDISAEHDFKSMENSNFSEDLNIPNERFGVGMSLMYQPAEKINVVLDFKHKSNSKWNDNSLNVGVKYHF